MSRAEEMATNIHSHLHRMASVNQLILQIRRNNMSTDNPQALLDEIDNLMRQQDTMRHMVDTTQAQTLKFQENLGGFDERLDVLKEQQIRMRDVTIAQLHSHLKRTIESVCSPFLYLSSFTFFSSLPTPCLFFHLPFIILILRSADRRKNESCLVNRGGLARREV